MSTSKDLRRLALSLEGTTEAPHFDRTAFRVKRIYVTLAADEKTANFMFTPEQQEFKCMMTPEAFAPVPNAGRHDRHPFRSSPLPNSRTPFAQPGAGPRPKRRGKWPLATRSPIAARPSEGLFTEPTAAIQSGAVGTGNDFSGYFWPLVWPAPSG